MYLKMASSQQIVMANMTILVVQHCYITLQENIHLALGRLQNKDMCAWWLSVILSQNLRGWAPRCEGPKASSVRLVLWQPCSLWEEFALSVHRHWLPSKAIKFWGHLGAWRHLVYYSSLHIEQWEVKWVGCWDSLYMKCTFHPSRFYSSFEVWDSCCTFYGS